MARKSQRLSSSSKATPAHKRGPSTTELSAADVKRSKNQKATPTKSQYFKGGDDQDHEVAAEDEVDESEELTSENEDGSEFGDGSESASLSEADDDDNYGSDRDDSPKSRKKTSITKTAAPSTDVHATESENWKPGSTQVVIKRPKARPAGKTPYSDETIHPNTLLFLQELKANNQRSWLKRK